jgi:ribosomal protein S18 acetylase RimI-like enzyme
MQNITFKELTGTNDTIFYDLLWIAINIPGTGRERSMIYDPMIKPFYQDWGQPDDHGYFALLENNIAGVIWSRIKECVTGNYTDYPEIGMAVYPLYQNKGIGSLLLNKLIETSKNKYPGLRLGVNHLNTRARNFYEKHGFVTYDVYNTAPQMKISF